MSKTAEALKFKYACTRIRKDAEKDGKTVGVMDDSCDIEANTPNGLIEAINRYYCLELKPSRVRYEDGYLHWDRYEDRYGSCYDGDPDDGGGYLCYYKFRVLKRVEVEVGDDDFPS